MIKTASSLSILDVEGRHTVDDSISTRVSEPDAPGHTKNDEKECDHKPEDDVEDIRVHPGELWSQV